MKLTLPLTALAAVLGLALAGIPVTANAQTTATGTTTASKAAAPKKTAYSGTLSAVDTTGNTITITDKTVAPKTIAITATTKIKKDKKPATLADFKVGDKVTGSFTTDATGALTAASLNTTTAKAKTKTAAKTTATGTTSSSVQ